MIARNHCTHSIYYLTAGGTKAPKWCPSTRVAYENAATVLTLFGIIMPHEIVFDFLPQGHATAAVKGPGIVPVRFVEFVSSEDGQELIQRLEGLPTEIIHRVGGTPPISPSTIDHLLAVIRRDRTATIYLNELPIILAIRVARDVQKGESIAKNDIVDIAEMDFGGITVPEDAGVAFVFSVGWRKGFFYDLGPLLPAGSPRPFDARAVFGQLYAHLLFQERFSILESEWQALFRAKWFPFVGLRNETIAQMLRHLRGVGTSMNSRVKSWQKLRGGSPRSS